MKEKVLIFLVAFLSFSVLYGNFYGLIVEMNKNGDTIAAWVDKSFRGNIFAAFLPAGGVWGAPDLLSDGTAKCLDPKVVMNKRGNVVAVWKALNEADANYIICGAELPFGGEWGAAVELSEEGDKVGGIVSAKLDDSGNIVVVWESFSGTPRATIRSVKGQFGVEWGTPETIFQ